MAGSLKPIPDGYHTINAYLTVQDGPAAIDFYQKAFGMESAELGTASGPCP